MFPLLKLVILIRTLKGNIQYRGKMFLYKSIYHKFWGEGGAEGEGKEES